MRIMQSGRFMISTCGQRRRLPGLLLALLFALLWSVAAPAQDVATPPPALEALPEPVTESVLDLDLDLDLDADQDPAARIDDDTVDIEEEPVVVGAAQPLYDVEVIVFLQRHDDLQPEFWRNDRRLPQHPVEAMLMRGATPSRLIYRELEPSERRLGALARQLDRGAAYTVLSHVAWRQPAADRQSAAAVALPTGVLLPRTERPGDAPPEAAAEADTAQRQISRIAEPQGYLRVWVERFVHLDASLRFPAPTAHPARSRDQADADIVFDLDTSRRLRTGRLHYIDHPALGILVRVDRVD